MPRRPAIEPPPGGGGVPKKQACANDNDSQSHCKRNFAVSCYAYICVASLLPGDGDYFGRRSLAQVRAWSRAVVYNFILVMANTGLRPPGARNLRWRDVDVRTDRQGRSFVCLNVHGKGKFRELVAAGNIAFYFDRIRELSKATEPNDFVFCEINGKSAATLYSATVKALLLPREADGHFRSNDRRSLRPHHADQECRAHFGRHAGMGSRDGYAGRFRGRRERRQSPQEAEEIHAEALTGSPFRPWAVFRTADLLRAHAAEAAAFVRGLTLRTARIEAVRSPA